MQEYPFLDTVGHETADPKASILSCPLQLTLKNLNCILNGGNP